MGRLPALVRPGSVSRHLFPSWFLSHLYSSTLCLFYVRALIPVQIFNILSTVPHISPVTISFASLGTPTRNTKWKQLKLLHHKEARNAAVEWEATTSYITWKYLMQLWNEKQLKWEILDKLCYKTSFIASTQEFGCTKLNQEDSLISSTESPNRSRKPCNNKNHVQKTADNLTISHIL